MSIKINNQEIMETFETWSIERKSTDGNITRIVFEDEEQARLEHKFYGGKLLKHTCYVSEGIEQEPSELEDLRA